MQSWQLVNRGDVNLVLISVRLNRSPICIIVELKLKRVISCTNPVLTVQARASEFLENGSWYYVAKTRLPFPQG